MKVCCNIYGSLSTGLILLFYGMANFLFGSCCKCTTFFNHLHSVFLLCCIYVLHVFQEKLLAKLYVEILGLAKNGDDAKKMLDYKNPKTNLTNTGNIR